MLALERPREEPQPREVGRNRLDVRAGRTRQRRPAGPLWVSRTQAKLRHNTINDMHVHAKPPTVGTCVHARCARARALCRLGVGRTDRLTDCLLVRSFVRR